MICEQMFKPTACEYRQGFSVTKTLQIQTNDNPIVIYPKRRVSHFLKNICFVFQKLAHLINNNEVINMNNKNALYTPLLLQYLQNHHRTC